MDDVFFPDGLVWVLSGVDQLAQARQSPIQSAQAEIRKKLYSGSMMAWALERSTGRMIPMLSNSWGTEWALRWLESGECMLPDEGGKVRITSERFDMFYRPENATIVISDIELQRLIDSKSDAVAGESAAGTDPSIGTIPPSEPDTPPPRDLKGQHLGAEGAAAINPSEQPPQPRETTQPTRERASRAIRALYPDGVPDDVTLPNSELCRSVGNWLKHQKLPTVSDATILRAAKRRK